MSAKTESQEEPVIVKETTPLSFDGEIYFPPVLDVWRAWSRVAAIPDALIGSKDPAGVTISAINLQQTGDGQAMLLMAKGKSKTGQKVAFHRAATAASALYEFNGRFQSGHIDWRDERPWQGTNNGQAEQLTPLPPPAP